MKTTFEFRGKGYLTLTAEGQSAVLSEQNPQAELELSDGAEIEAVHSEKEPAEKEKITFGKILLLIVLIPIIFIIFLIIFIIAFAAALFGGMDGIAAEKYFCENNPFKTRKKFILSNAGETVQFTAEKPVFAKKTLEYVVLPQITAYGASTAEEATYSYEQKHTRLNYKTDAYPQCIIIGIASIVLAVLGVFFIFRLPPIAENPVFFILGLLCSLVLISFPALAVWAMVKIEKTLKKTEQNILTLTKGKTEK